MRYIKKNIFIVVPIDPFKQSGGGMVTYTYSLVNRLSKYFNFTLMGINFKENSNIIKKLKFIPITTIPKNKIRKKSSLNYAWNLFRKKKSIKNLDGVFHVQRTDSSFPLLYPIKINSPLVFTRHGSITDLDLLGKNYLYKRIFYIMEYLVIKKADKIIMVSKKSLKEYYKLYPKFKNKITYIPNGVDTEKFHPNDKKNLRKKYGMPLNAKILLYAGRFVEEKGIDFLLKSFEIIASQDSNILFVFIGEGSLLHEITEYKKRIKNIEILPSVSNEKMPEIYNFANVLVMASYFEGWSMTMGEALACGIPVVTTNVGDVEEIIKNGKNGYIVKNRDPKEFAEKCILALNKYDDMGDYCRETAKRYSLENMVDKTKKIYEELMEK